MDKWPHIRGQKTEKERERVGIGYGLTYAVK